MLHVITSLDLKKLADSLYDKLYQCWDNPFDSPTVIFPDAKTEQWFRFYVLKENKTNVLMNLNCDRLDSFLFKTLKDGDEQRLTVNILRDFLILKLSSKISENIFYFQTLDSPEVETYLQVENGINQNHLYDFAQQMAELFIEYENTRNKTFFNTLPKWQKKLYDDVTDININGVQYSSIPQLFNKKTYFNFNSKLPVYLFGFSGMGQIYRNILKDFAKQYDLYVFLQTIDTDAQNNALLKSWSKFGHDNYTLWSNESENIISERPKDSLLHKIQNYIITDKSNTERLSLDSSLSITAAPTKIREIECLHTKVCNLLKSDSVSLSDILVLAPDIQEYRVAINQIFDAVDSKNNQYPYIPYNIVDFSAKNSLTVVILETIANILKQKYYSRADFFALVNNPVFQRIYDIIEQDIEIWTQWIVDNNVYRDRLYIDDNGNLINPFKDWLNIKYRLLLSNLTSHNIVVDDIERSPYSNINTGNKSSLYKFIQIIDNLELLLKFAYKEFLSAQDVSDFRDVLDNLILLPVKSQCGYEFLVYQQIIQTVNNQLNLLKNSKLYVPTTCFLLSLIDSVKSVSVNSGTVFSHGLTFTSFKPNSILTAKYIFFIGLNEKDFPGKDIQNVLDCRESEIGDDILTVKNKNAFLCQLLSAQDGCFISYQDANLQKDEQLYVSSVANEIIDFVGKESDTENAKYILYEDVVSVDETRDWGQIFTPRAARNKINYTMLTDEIGAQTNNDTVDNNTEKLDLPDKVKISDIYKFLEDAFKFAVNSKLGYDDDLGDIENQDTEPYNLDNIAESNLKKLYVKLKMKDTPDEEIEQNIMAQLTCDKPFDKFVCAQIKKDAKDLYDKIESINISEFDSAINLQLHNDVTNKNWVLSGPLVWYNKDFTTASELNVVDMKKGNILPAYVTSLALIASQQNDKSFSVNLVTLNINDEKPNLTENYTLSPSEAREYLNKIYESAYNDRYTKCLPINLVDDKAIDSLSDFINKLDGKYGEWRYFKNGKLIDAYKDLGYINENFDKEFQQNIKDKKQLVKYLNETKDTINE